MGSPNSCLRLVDPSGLREPPGLFICSALSPALTVVELEMEVEDCSIIDAASPRFILAVLSGEASLEIICSASIFKDEKPASSPKSVERLLISILAEEKVL